MLASNGGAHFVAGARLAFSTSSTGAVTVGSGSYLFTEDSSIPQSPASAGPQWMTTTDSSLAPSLSVPTLDGQRYLLNGAIVFSPASHQVQISYNGPNIQATYLAADNQTVVETLQGTSYTIVPLSGTIANSPSELFTASALGILTNTINGNSLYNHSATWQSGAAYMKSTRHIVGDTVLVGDCAAPATTGTNVTPCSTTTTTLSAFFPYASSADGRTYNLSDGQIVTLAGVQAWVSTAAINSPTTEYRVYFALNGQIYSAVLIRDGTVLQTLYAGSTAPQDFYLYLNAAAVQSVKAALTL
ncbi:hypothetical protein [Paraburkholderia sp. J12]|uniref:hypothetical protein n=1 Tax=Paraburkholderia sp. J12 TaxID=2805432 RepID=UPI002ABD5B1A|nr:hypothetical protein [Paraburkholderia sp. J12]